MHEIIAMLKARMDESVHRGPDADELHALLSTECEFCCYHGRTGGCDRPLDPPETLQT